MRRSKCQGRRQMKGGRMPKDPTRNINQYKIEGGQLNEFEFNRNQGEISREEQERFERQEEERHGRAEDSPPAPKSEGERIAQMTAAAKKRAGENLKRRQKQSGKGAPASARKRASGGKKSSRKVAAAK